VSTLRTPLRFSKQGAEPITSPEPRIDPLIAPFDEPAAELLARMMPSPEIEPIALFRLMAKNFAMADAGWKLGSYELGRDLSLDRRTREIVIDRTCARLGCEYEWSVHIAYFAERVGLTPEQVSSLTHGAPADPCWDSHVERIVIGAVDAMVDTGDIADDLWAGLASALDEAQLLDLLLLTGWYHAICFTARITRLPLEPGCPTFASVTPPAAPASVA
jgi:alkylhydroperoxidase family enzyme